MSKNKITLDNICGYKEEKKEVANIITLLKGYNKYEKQGVTIPRGLIFQGPPGTGKTLFAKAIAGECGYDFNVAFSNELSENTLDTLKKAFEKAEAKSKKDKKPALIYIDELDKLVYTDNYGQLVDKEAREAARFLLQKLDETKNKNRVLIIASTNNYDRIPRALLRSGRFDKKFLISFPDAESRRDILKFYINSHPLFADININALALKTAGMSGADLKTLINNTLLEYITKKDKLELDDFIKIINEMNFETIGKQWASDKVALETLAHEIGHEVILFKLTGTWNNINALKYGDFGGCVTYTTNEDELPFEEEPLNEIEEKDDFTYQTVLDEVCGDLGGMAGEKVLLNEKSLGLSGDFHNIRRRLSLLNNNACFGFEIADAFYDDSIPPNIRLKQFNYYKRIVKHQYRRAIRIVKSNKILCLYLIDEIHKNNDILAGEQVKEKYKYFLTHKKELVKKYRKLKVGDLAK